MLAVLAALAVLVALAAQLALKLQHGLEVLLFCSYASSDLGRYS